MNFRFLVTIFILFAGVNALATNETDYIKIVEKDGRQLFHSKKFGSFFSVGSNSFMESAANLKMKDAFKAQPFADVYEEQFQSYLEFGFNTLGGWSNTEYLKGRLPYTVVLFDDEEYPHFAPLKDCKGNILPSGDADPLLNPFNDPFDPAYTAAVKKYLKTKVRPYAKDTSLMLYWVGHEFGIGGSDYVDLAKFTYSSGIQREFATWLKLKYGSIGAVESSWGLKAKKFEDFVKECPQFKSPVEIKDRKKFVSHVLRKWFELVVGEIRKNDPNHLLSTPKFSVWDHQPQLELSEKDGHFEAMKNLFDLMSVDWYTANTHFSERSMSQILKAASSLKLPVLVAEFGTRQKVEGWTNTPGAKTLVSSQEERGERYRTQLIQLFKNKKFIGAHWFRWQDHITKTDQMNKGVVQVNGAIIEPYKPLQKAMEKVHQEIANDDKSK